ncbi:MULTISPECIES: hypothetical protein [Clostridium]|uniref:hypothetical protein n=1 Tax=Clostridium TaxID=1485 RepID=UPI00258067E8|nr:MULTISPECIES: hypothetical protein [Clostridium]MBS4841563.1 hypothetical protein [Clostridium sp.]MDU1403387.1 hypothetical protein [Clostridium sp.]MDU2896590.1 hypothetical protein [Clostridium sp.]MDU3007146.1 hypothetical protein [Clostridium sp.]MDU3038964.1 hypothetical protein [Clostridium sp.]
MYSEYPIIRLRDRTDLNERASNWFHKKWGIPKEVYLITDHTNFYEKCGWNFLCMVEENDGYMIRMYHFKCEH